MTETPDPARSLDEKPPADTAPYLTNEGLTPVHPDHVKVLRISALIPAIALVIGLGVLDANLPTFPGLIVIPAIIVAILLIWRLPWRRYNHKGYDMGTDRLRVVRGVLFRSDSVVPFGRVQHIDVQQGPIERLYGLATLILHTAGTHNASVHLAGLLREDAESIRETIRQHIKRDSL